MTDNHQQQQLLEEARQAYRALRLEDTVAAYEEVLARDASNYEAHVGLARVYTRMRREKEAQRHAQESIDLAPDRWEGHAALGVLYFLIDQVPESRQALEKAASLEPESPEPLLTLSQVASDEGDYEEASEYLQEARRLIDEEEGEGRRDELRAMAWHAETYGKLSQGDREGALAAAEEVIALEEANPYAACLAHSNMGILEARARHYDRAVEHLTKACEMNPHFYKAASALGRLLIVQGRHEEAVAALEQALERGADGDSSTRYAYAVALAKTGRRQAALTQYEKAIQEGLDGIDGIIARAQMIWLSKWGRRILIGIPVAGLVAWFIFGQPSQQVLTLILVVVAVLVLQQIMGRR